MASNPAKKLPLPAISEWLATIFVLAVAAGLLLAQSNYSETEGGAYSLSGLEKRATFLQGVTNLVQRDSYCIPLSAYGRQLDEHLQMDARIFMGNMIGKTNGGKLGYYYFLRNALFPRKVEISLDGHATFVGGGFEGIACDDPEILVTNGFDLLIAQGPNGMQLMPLSVKGVPK